MRILLFTLLPLLLCCKAQKNSSDSNSEKACAEGFTQAVVKDQTTLDGCGFILVLADGTKLLPLNPIDEFNVDGKIVCVKYFPDKKAMTTCMSGTPIRITEIIAK